MKIFLSVGHSRLKNGNYTSADGKKYGGCNEYIYNKNLAKKIKKKLEEYGHVVTLCICPEKKFRNATEEKNYKISRENSGNYDLSIELHLNASSSHDVGGCEVLYLSSDGKGWADTISENLGSLFKNRGSKYRDNLYFLKKTKSPAIMIESFFCDCKSDYVKANQTKVCDLICKAFKPLTLYKYTINIEPSKKKKLEAFLKENKIKYSMKEV